ncbi:MAG: type II toxin-antitoxin system HicA family toxin [Bdellovibrionales bacterium]|nr:type II toxin-antitoxin system HicA family toxin [Bdellovibrionales bacterium]
MPLSGKELIKLLKKMGWKLDRVSGSHFVMVKARKTVIVPVHANRSLGKGLETKLLKQTGVKKK